LHIASRYSHVSLLFEILKDLNNVDVKADSKDIDDGTSLSWAAEGRHEAVVKQLVKRDDIGADSKDESGRTPLSWAAVSGHETVVKVLLATGKADVAVVGRSEGARGGGEGATRHWEGGRRLER
jgi:ankyrin repeat protein